MGVGVNVDVASGSDPPTTCTVIDAGDPTEYSLYTGLIATRIVLGTCKPSGTA